MNTLMPIKVNRRKISLTALIDVVFILLMFFMLTSTFNQWRSITLENAGVSNGQSAHNREPYFFRLYEDGALSLWPSNQHWPSFNLLHNTSVAQFDPLRPVLLIPEETVRLQTMLSAIEHFKNTGIEAQLTDPVKSHEVK